jgi:iron complex outermembrane receptor protein
MNRPTLLTIAILIAFASQCAQAQDHAERAADQLDEVVVTASPLRRKTDDLARPIEVVTGTALDDQREKTLGESVARLPGVQSSFFGAGVGRPIIRGLDGARVQVLSEGIGSLDVSTVSADHAVTIEPFLADQIEVLKGPATLLFGSGAVGGAVNVVDGRIHEQAVDGFGGRMELRGNTVADERAGAFRIDGDAGRLGLHADAFYRETGDYEIPGFAERGHDDHDHGDDHEDEETRGLLENSRTRVRGGAFGASYIGERGFLGGALSRYENRYGVPGHSHGHEDHDDEGDDDHEEEHGDVVIDMEQTRTDVKSGLNRPFSGHEALRVRIAHNDYRHVELEGDEIGTRFENTGTEARIELVHAPIAGWTGAYGTQVGQRDFEAIGEEAFVPPSESSDLGLFLIERREWERASLEAGGRYDRVKVDPDFDHPSVSTGAFSASLAGEWRFSGDWHLRLGLDRAQRAPGAEELYSDGLHVATGGYEIGHPGLDKETANQVELGLHYHGQRVELKLAAYLNRFDDFIYLAETGEDIDESPIRQWRQDDAEFHGGEAELGLTLADNASGRYRLRLMADTVRGELDDGLGNLPRIAPGRFGAGLDWNWNGWRASISALHYRRQNRIATNETSTPGFTLVGADLAYAIDVGDEEIEVFLQGRNLGNEEARLHTSFLKDVAPLPGRSMGFGVRAYF